MKRSLNSLLERIGLALPRDLALEYDASLAEALRFGARAICFASVIVIVAAILVQIILIGVDQVKPSAVAIFMTAAAVLAAGGLATWHPGYQARYRQILTGMFVVVFALAVTAGFYIRPENLAMFTDYCLLLSIGAVLVPLSIQLRVPLIFLCTTTVGWLKVMFSGVTVHHQVVLTLGSGTILSMLAMGTEWLLQRGFRLRRQLSLERDRGETLLRQIFPQQIFERVKSQDSPAFYDHFPDVSVLFADLVGFTAFTASRPAAEVVSVLKDIFNRLDVICDRAGAVKIKTMGDAYMVAAGLPDPDPRHPLLILDLAFEFREAVHRYALLSGLDLQLRIGVHCGPVVAGIIGSRMLQFDLWGDTVNVASRLESTGIGGRIQISAALAARVGEAYHMTDRGDVQLKGHGAVRTFLVDRPRLPAPAALAPMARSA